MDDPVKLCDFQLLENRIMKTVDSVYQVKLLWYFNRVNIGISKIKFDFYLCITNIGVVLIVERLIMN